jgi:transcriptional regulator with XRE-family HTH domain
MIKKIEALLKRKKINRSDLAKGTGIHYTTIYSLWTQGTENIKRSNLVKIADFLGCSIDYLADDNISIGKITMPIYHTRRKDKNIFGILRCNRGWTQQQLAEKLGTSQIAISHWENNRSKPSSDLLEKLSLIYGIPVETLLNTNDDLSNTYKTIIKNSTKNENTDTCRSFIENSYKNIGIEGIVEKWSELTDDSKKRITMAFLVEYNLIKEKNAE